jgi:hypothetical protein
MAGERDENDKDAFLRLERDKDNLFGGGVENAVLRFTDRSEIDQTRLIALQKFSAAILTLGFDFVEPSTLGGESPFIVRMGVARNDDKDRFVNVRFRNGKIGPALQVYSLDKKHSLRIVVNNTAEPVAYAGRRLVSQAYDIWLDGELIVPDSPFDTNQPLGRPLTALSFLTGKLATDQEFMIDAVRIWQGARVP